MKKDSVNEMNEETLKNNIMQKWRKQYTAGEGFYEIESPTVMPKEVLKASDM